MAKNKTYEEFEADAKASGLYDTFSEEDLERAKTDADYGYGILNDKKGWKAAEATGDKEGMQFYSELANTRRQTYGQGSGKQSAASQNALAAIKAYDASLPGDKSSKYLTMIDSILQSVVNDKFSYDPKSDPRYALAEEYAGRAMENQMAESALLTGGYGNSYAAASGQQVYTDYMNDAVSDMEDRAYQKWSAERDNKYNLLGLARDMEQQEYDRVQTERQWKYQEEQDAKADEETKKTNAQNIVYDYIMTTGGIENLSPEEIAATGWSEAYINSLITKSKEAKTTEEAAPVVTGAGKPVLTLKEAEAAYKSGNKSSNVLAALKYYYGDDYIDNVGDGSGVDRTADSYVNQYLIAKEALGNNPSDRQKNFVFNKLADAVNDKKISKEEFLDIAERLGL